MANRNENHNWQDRNRGMFRHDRDERGDGNDNGYRDSDFGRDDYGMRDDEGAGGRRYGSEGGRAGGSGYGDGGRGGAGGYGDGGYEDDRGYGRNFGTRGDSMGRGNNYRSGAGAYNRSEDMSYGRNQGTGRSMSDRGTDRGLMNRASDEVSSWFGDSAAQNRREADHRGRGPKGYQRSDSRIEEDINDQLTDDQDIDPSEIQIKVKGGEVTLDGTVDSKMAKRHAEDCCDRVSA